MFGDVSEVIKGGLAEMVDCHGVTAKTQIGLNSRIRIQKDFILTQMES